MTTYLESLRAGLDESLASSEEVIVLGEDIVDPYGGAFKVTRGLSSKYPNRVVATPISEAGFSGMAVGMAVRGMKPVVEIMFGDFLTLCADQIVNHMTKFGLMYSDVSVPVVVRTPSGAGRGYGATHSQSLEKMFLGVPGLKVIAPSLAHDVRGLLRSAVLDDVTPVLFVEDKLSYSQPLLVGEKQSLTVSYISPSEKYPTAVVRNIPDVEPDIIVCSYGGGARVLFSVMEYLADEEISIQAIIPSQISPLPISDILESIDCTISLMIIEDGSEGFNWGAELSAVIYEKFCGGISQPIHRLSSSSDIIPCSQSLESESILTQDKVENAILEVLS